MFEIVPHMADVRLEVSAPSLEELFTEAMRGMYAVMRGSAPRTAPTVHRRINVVDSADGTALLVDFLNEVLHRAHVGGEMYRDVRFTRFEPATLTAELAGTAGAEFEEDIKAVTYHEADVRLGGKAWKTTLVFDL